jgi:hypothetical protein
VQTPDPVTHPSEYQQALLELLGPDDPAEVQARTPDDARTLLRAAGELATTRPSASEWSAQEAVGHIVHAEVVSTARYRWILAHERPPLIGYDQDLWVQALQPDRESPERLLDLFAALRRANLELWQESTPDQRARVGVHQERGDESYDLTFRLIAGHDRLHMGQAAAALDSLR